MDVDRATHLNISANGRLKGYHLKYQTCLNLIRKYGIKRVYHMKDEYIFESYKEMWD